MNQVRIVRLESVKQIWKSLPFISCLQRFKNIQNAQEAPKIQWKMFNSGFFRTSFFVPSFFCRSLVPAWYPARSRLLARIQGRPHGQQIAGGQAKNVRASEERVRLGMEGRGLIFFFAFSNTFRSPPLSESLEQATPRGAPKALSV